MTVFPITASADPRESEASPRHTEDATAQDADLARRLAGGDPDALAAVYDRFAPSLYRVLAAILGSSADAEDALQEVFVRVAEGRARRVRDLRSYLFAAARNEACSLLRRRRRERPLADGEEDGILTTPDSTFDGQALLGRLPVEQREVIAMKVYEEMTFAEIAAIVRAPLNTVASRYRYGIERLRAWCREEDEEKERGA